MRIAAVTLNNLIVILTLVGLLVQELAAVGSNPV
jgi:hypothetical protein